MQRFACFGALLVIVLFAGVAVLALEMRRQHLRSTLAKVEAESRSTPSTSAAISQPSAIAGKSWSAEGSSALEETEITEARREVAALEQRAEQRRTEVAAESARRLANAFVVDPNNHDPERGMVMVDLFQNVGRATPASAFQTLVWAALKDDQPTLASGLSLDDRARARAEDLIARQPESVRAQLTPEKLAALWFEDAVVDTAAAQIIGQMPIDDAHVNLIVRGGIAPGHTLTLRQADAGWQLVVPEAGLEAIQKKVVGSSAGIK